MERIRTLIDEAVAVPSIERIVFTGGECFLLGSKLDDVVGRASAHGFITRVISNGYWAVNARAARARIARLRKHGLDEIMLSTGTFHQQFVPVQRVAHAARAAVEHGVLTRVSVEACDQSTFDADVLRATLSPLIADGSVVLSCDPWIQDAGYRGRTDLSHERYIEDTGVHGLGRCAQILNVISVTQNQELVACCGFPSEQLPRLRLGSVADATLGDVLSAAPNELLKMWLHVAGPAGIAAFVARYVPGYRLAPAASICQSCAAIQRDPRAMDVIARYGAEAAQTVAAQYLQLQHKVRTHV